MSSDVDVAELNVLPQDGAVELLRPVCASHAWLRAIVDARPYRDLAELSTRSDELLATLEWQAIEDALAAHPRIGDRPAGTDREAGWSRQEQSGAATASPEVADALRAGNVAYEQRFGRVFLICATGRTAEEMLAELTRRLGNDEAAEREVVRRELAAIVRLRLAKALR
ncbi:MAG TPA: 2-oxo-4-hydroxy-4-carboxy-5-ureidoimidazoline decarboxylase [Jatrophihabitans sp.]|jgi:2-oxo-4-hydroxy-4-carboxy-5-ureidoimidazoline decarboxylase|nr:2-oxo-4-hydroxy-4-carboxy-5-ureidoimidazoline decarboxylase [Jatrophihabitans sp.]